MYKLLHRIVITILVIFGCSVINVSSTRANYSIEQTWIFPVDGMISDFFGSRGGNHKGLDIAGEEGTAVVAVEQGVVSKSYFSSSYGNVVFILHNSGYETVYAHLQSRSVGEGEVVQQGEQIGLMGSTGRSTGSHLHFEVHSKGWTYEKEGAVDPFHIFGKGEIGQAVTAHQHNPYHEERLVQVNKAVSPYEMIHIVKHGDTLWALSQKYETSVEAIQLANRLDGTTIVVSEKLSIPISKTISSNY
ncbi:peptidoglycan DD-metalloendopeptidase family protein [Bacillus sp. 2205SS5-2]|uniref:peptidoglycan DD-metalloendopeptidase family protein n=1 Tax=Bacillus sp. 2205SS5-2 TaxID=3109031 RepID=UPI003004540B